MNVDKVHKTCPNNRESTVIKHVNGDGASIPPWVIFNSIEIQGTWAENNVRNSVVFIQMIGLVMNGSDCLIGRLRDTEGLPGAYSFWTAIHHTIPLNLSTSVHRRQTATLNTPSHKTHLLQPLDVEVFQPMKH